MKGFNEHNTISCVKLSYTQYGGRTKITTRQNERVNEIMAFGLEEVDGSLKS